MILATTRNDIAGYVETLGWVYTLLIIAYILSSMFFAVGGRLPYNRAASAIIGFLRDVSEPYLRIFRRFIPPLGPFDLSPVVGIILIRLVTQIVANAIRG